MEQRVPNLTHVDIQQIISREFPQFGLEEVERVLEHYKSDSEKGRNRVYAAILKLSEGNFASILEHVLKANNDFRDVIGEAEYPHYSKVALATDVSEEKKARLIGDDWDQYEAWIEKR